MVSFVDDIDTALWVDCEAFAGCVQAPDVEIRLRACVDLPTARRRALRARADELAELLGDTRFTVRFPSTLSAALLRGDDEDLLG